MSPWECPRMANTSIGPMQQKIYATLALIGIVMLFVWNDGDLTAIKEGLTRLATR